MVHCPIYVKPAIEPGEWGCKVTPCPHLAFIYIGEVSEYEYKSPDFDKKTGNIDVEELSCDDFKTFLQNAEHDNELLAIEITYGGMACGPVCYTDVYGFDYTKLAAKKDEV